MYVCLIESTDIWTILSKELQVIHVNKMLVKLYSILYRHTAIVKIFQFSLVAS